MLRQVRRWRRTPIQRPSTIIGCQAAHEAISALSDGESPPISEALMKAHLAQCQNCGEFQEKVVSLRRQMSIRVLAPVPDRTSEILVALGFPDRPVEIRAPSSTPRRRVFLIRTTQWASGVIPLGIAGSALALGAFANPHLLGSHVLTPCTQFLAHHHPGR